MAEKLRVGVIGTGYVSKNNYLPVLAQTEDIEFVGVMAKNFENAVRAARSFGAQQAVDSIEKLVDLGLDCAFVLTPKQVHAEQVTFLLNHGVGTFCEKPMATTLRVCGEIAELSEKTGRKLMIGFNRRYAPVVTAAKEAWNGGMPDVIIAQKNRPQTEYHATLSRTDDGTNCTRKANTDHSRHQGKNARRRPLWKEAAGGRLLPGIHRQRGAAHQLHLSEGVLHSKNRRESRLGICRDFR